MVCFDSSLECFYKSKQQTDFCQMGIIGGKMASVACPYTCGKCASQGSICRTKPCLNGGVCVENEQSKFGYVCQCPKQFSGDLCEESKSKIEGVLNYDVQKLEN